MNDAQTKFLNIIPSDLIDENIISILNDNESFQLINSVDTIGKQTNLEIFLKSAISSKYISISKKLPLVFGFNETTDLIGKTNLDVSPDIAGYKIKSCIKQLDHLTQKNNSLNCL